MVFKLEDTQLVVDGRSVIRSLIGLQIVIGLCKAIYMAEKRYSAALHDELTRIKKEQKLSKKNKKKVESE